MADGAAAALADPILNPPYDIPDRHFEFDSDNRPTGTVVDGRRRSETFIPVPRPRPRGRGGQQAALDFDVAGERREPNHLVNDLRVEVGRWRDLGYPRVSATTRGLLLHWADPERENRVLFCQREAAETAIFLAEVAGRHGYADWRTRLAEPNAAYNEGLPRVALKMATGTGKTVVMAMLIAWQTLNKLQSPRDVRFTRRFVIITPGITIRDRLRVLQPGQPGNYYDERELVPAHLQVGLRQAQVVITNWHAFQPRDAGEVAGVSTTTRKLLRGDTLEDPFRESPQAVVTRVLRGLGGGREAVIVFNDEAHHCYRDRPIPSGAPKPTAEEKAQQKADQETARRWFRGVQAIAKHAGVKTVYDLSATPFFLAGSGWDEGLTFPWTVSDFGLMEAIESGIVKAPRLPVDDDATGEQVTYLHLWEYVGRHLPRGTRSRVAAESWIIPPELEGALHSLYRSYEKAYAEWERDLAPYGEPPPVFIVVCQTTVVSKLVHDWIAGQRTVADIDVPGELALFSNYEPDRGRWRSRPVTILIDGAQLDSGEPLSKDFRAAAGPEIDAFKVELRRRPSGLDVDSLTDADLLREVMNTVGKKGRLGEGVRCVVSVAMLTEGWDANTVSHILGVRAFGSQLLCEQVVGRGLRRRSYELNDEGRFDAEYASVYGIPFLFLRGGTGPGPGPIRPPFEVASVPGREERRITFPRLAGYRMEIPDRGFDFDSGTAERLSIGPSTVPGITIVEPLVGGGEIDEQPDPASFRRQQIAYAVAKRVLALSVEHDDDRRPWLFPQLVAICREWLTACVDLAPGHAVGQLMWAAQFQQIAAERIHRSLLAYGDRRGRLRPMLRPFDAEGSTEGIRFVTRKALETTTKSEVSHVTLDGKTGNTWEQLLALACELDPQVAAYVKNERLGFTIPYVHEGVTHVYHPDFLLRLVRRPGDVLRTLIVEVSGGRKSPGPRAVKARTARDLWCAAVNNQGGFGRWGYVEIASMDGVREALGSAVDLLYADAPIVGDPDVRDFELVERRGVA